MWIYHSEIHGIGAENKLFAIVACCCRLVQFQIQLILILTTM